MKQRNAVVDVFRFVFTLYVIASHMLSSFGITFPYPRNGWFSVEFFFVLSGFLLAASCDKVTPPRTARCRCAGAFAVE